MPYENRFEDTRPRGRPAALPRHPAHGAGGIYAPIGEVAREFGVSLRTLRFYEDKGLLAPLRRGTARLYGPVDRGRLATIFKGKALGFTLREIRAMVAASEANDAGGDDLPLSPDQVRGQIDQLEQRRAEIESALARLKGLEDA